MENRVGFFRRLLALLIDYFVLIVVATVLMFVLVFLSGLFGFTDKVISFYEWHLLLLFSFIYYGHPLKKSAQTLGEKVMKFKVVHSEKEKITIIAAVVRTIFLMPVLALLALIVLPYKEEKLSGLEIAAGVRLKPLCKQ